MEPLALSQVDRQFSSTGDEAARLPTGTAVARPSEIAVPGEGRRYFAIDSLRAWMMLLLIPFHAAVPFITVRAMQRFNDPDAHVFFDGFVLLLLSFRRPIFFLVGGFFAAMLLDRRGRLGMLHNRFQRIVLPLVLGWVVLAPATLAAYKFAAAAASSGTIEGGIQSLENWNWLRWKNPFHLWFLLALLLFYGCALGLKWALPRLLGPRLPAFKTSMRRFLASPWRPLMLAAIVALGLVPSEFYPHYRGNPFLGLALALFFGLGWVMYEQRDLLEAQGKHAWKYLAAGLFILPFATLAKWSHLHGSEYSVAWALAAGIAIALMSSFLVFGVLGVFLRYSNHRSATMRYLSDSSYWIYLAHMPIVVFVGGVLSTTSLSAIPKLLITTASTTGISLITYHYCVRYTAIGTLLNGPRERKASGAGDAG